jgi:hypothetical protein
MMQKNQGSGMREQRSPNLLKAPFPCHSGRIFSVVSKGGNQCYWFVACQALGPIDLSKMTKGNILLDKRQYPILPLLVLSPTTKVAVE